MAEGRRDERLIVAGWTKADYDGAYRYHVERHMPEPRSTFPQVVIRYHRLHMRPILAAMWATLQPILNILSGDHVCVVGAGFGWGVEAVAAETGAVTVGIDISDYIAAELAGTEEAELRAEVAAVGLDPDTGRGLEVMNFIYDGQPRGSVIVLQNDAASGPQRAAIRSALGNNWPDVVVYENIVDDTWTDTDIINARNAGNGFGGQQRLIWVYKGTPTRTYQNLFDLLPSGSEVISTDGLVYLS